MAADKSDMQNKNRSGMEINNSASSTAQSEIEIQYWRAKKVIQN